MNNLCLTFYLLCFAFSSFAYCAIDETASFDHLNEELTEQYYDNYSDDEDSGPMDWFKHYGKSIDDFSSDHSFMVGCYLFHIAMKKCQNSKINASTPSCQLRKDDSDGVCRACFYADFVIDQDGHFRYTRSKLIYMDCNKVHYQHPTIRIPSKICKESKISPDCHPGTEQKDKSEALKMTNTHD